MKKIIYYVAVSLDGYISGLEDDVSKFSSDSKLVKRYQNDLMSFTTTIMGRKTYEFGYAYGLNPGQPAYPHMEHFIFSDHLSFEQKSDKVHVEKMNIDRIDEIKEHASSDIYLCGGGEFAGWLLDHSKIDQLKLKINPIILGCGTKLFGPSKKSPVCTFVEEENFGGGLRIVTFDLHYSSA